MVKASTVGGRALKFGFLLFVPFAAWLVRSLRPWFRCLAGGDDSLLNGSEDFDRYPFYSVASIGLSGRVPLGSTCVVLSIDYILFSLPIALLRLVRLVGCVLVRGVEGVLTVPCARSSGSGAGGTKFFSGSF